MSKISMKQIWAFMGALLICASVDLGNAEAMSRDGLFSRLKCSSGGGLFSCNHDREMTTEEADTDQSDEVVIETSDESPEKSPRKGLFARIRSKKAAKDVTTDAQDLTEQSSSDLPAETIPPAPKG